MNCCIFVGPTLRPADRARFPDAIWEPPAKQGDVYRAVSLLLPRSIGIVDGYFRWVPSVWHKEILWAMSRGVHVFGAASMGALRAAELDSYGMHGIGRIFMAYRTGILAPFGEPFEDDDEVAVVHGPEDSGYLAASEAMVNIRLTLVAAERVGVISQQTMHSLVGLAKALYFPERNYERIVQEARAQGVAASELDALHAFLPQGRVDQKRVDALDMIDTMKDFARSEPGPCQAEFRFEHTTLWNRVVRGLNVSSPHDPQDLDVLAEARLQGGRFIRHWNEVFAALTDPQPPAHQGNAPRWMPPVPEMFVRRRAYAIDAMRRRIPAPLVERHLLARLRQLGEYGRLLERAQDKRQRLRGQVGSAVVWTFNDAQLLDLENWYFTQCLGSEIPDDLPGYIALLGYPDKRAFHEAIFEEHCYRETLRSNRASAHEAQERR